MRITDAVRDSWGQGAEFKSRGTKGQKSIQWDNTYVKVEPIRDQGLLL
jgi:hypothetical protein